MIVIDLYTGKESTHSVDDLKPFLADLEDAVYLTTVRDELSHDRSEVVEVYSGRSKGRECYGGIMTLNN